MLKMGRRVTITVRVLLIAVLLLAVLGAAGCTEKSSGDKLTVVATIFPLADFVKNVAGDKAEVVTLLPPGASPHTYELTPGGMKTVNEAKLLVINGAGLDFWIVEEMESTSDLLVVDTSAIPTMEGALLAGDEHEHEHEGDEGHEHGDANPHIWLDPVLAQKQVEAIATALVMVDPENQDFYLDNAADYIAELRALDAEIEETTQGFSSREFITFHPAWTYFAERYYLVEAAVIEESPGKEASVEYIKHVIDVAKEYQVRAIFAEPQFSTKAADAIASDSGAEVLLLDPIGGAEVTGRDSYISLMRYNVEQMKQAMQ